MNDPRQPESWEHRYPPVDPAYAGQPPYASTYGLYPPPPSPVEWNPTQQLPQYWQQGEPPPPPGGGPPPMSEAEFPTPEGPRSPWWLWFIATAAVLLVVGMVIALVIANSLAKQPTAVPPLPAMPTPSSITRTPTHAPTTSTEPTTGPSAPTETTSAAAMQTVVYNVTGEGRAISITYRDTGDVMETEFNVLLPWSKQVSLQQSANHSAIVTIINIGHDVTCSVTVGGVQVRQHTGVGLTICSATN